MSTELEPVLQVEEENDSHALRVIGWFSVGMAVAAIGLYVGREMRNRYQFRQRTPYDFYSNAGENPISEFGVGV
ncbi:MAG: hypothetical protein KGN79_03080 [Acidobacteriota bacterium]|nr:hypothetical protein [Acidobacteriota bacterium]